MNAFFLFLFIFSRIFTVDASPQGDTLLEIKKSLRDPDNVLQEWTKNSSLFCSWRGVTCSNLTFDVTDLMLSKINLGGKISPAIGELKSLRHVNFSDNNIEGNIPSSVSKLKYLRFLDLTNNKLTGEIPKGIYQNNITLLFLQDNNLTGTLFDMCQSPQIVYLNVRNNHLTGSIPSCIENCTTLKVLDLAFNKLVGEIPFNIGFLPLQFLFLQGNELTGRIPSSIGFLQNLSELHLSYNFLSGPIPHTLGNLTVAVEMYLNNNKLTGSIPPELGSMTSLWFLDFSNNNLEGPIPEEFTSLRKLTQLTLSSNSLEGPIPIGLSQIPKLNSLFLANNLINGSIPTDIGEMKSLIALDLSNNQILGPIPKELGQLQSLISLNLSYNKLTGDFPIWNFTRFSSNSFLGNPRISHSPKQASKFKATLFISAFGILAILVVVVAIWCRRKSPTQIVNIVVLNENIASLTYKDIRRGTYNMSEKYKIGEGASCNVYKCVTRQCTPLAIKKIKQHYKRNVFMTEIETLTGVQHDNVVCLQGYLLSPDEKLLIYEFMENGNLKDLLRNPERRANLNWEMRLKMALGVARAIAYLHDDCIPRVVHRDIKSANILLNKDYRALISDFGIARHLSTERSHTSTNDVVGTIGYIAPDYTKFNTLNEKADVYAYGVVLLEILTGREVIMEDKDSLLRVAREEQKLDGGAMRMIDPAILSTSNNNEDLNAVFNIAICCARDENPRRPRMRSVVQGLEFILFPNSDRLPFEDEHPSEEEDGGGEGYEEEEEEEEEEDVDRIQSVFNNHTVAQALVLLSLRALFSQ